MFLTPLELIALPTPDLWALGADLIWEDDRYGRLIAPVGFHTDLASTPFHADDNGPSRLPAAMHDALYRLYRGKGKSFADNFLRDAIIAQGGGRVRSQAYYLGVHWFGGSAWESDGSPLTAAEFDSMEHYQAWLAMAANLPR